ncbi:HAMP domain-containing protein [Heliobacterium gestii]|uniref:HAMP domain-containing protein n=1 Tax=Heliomicrobium gestii TaxID=2699 RepID=A0A845L899_HELGE|nr:methyl-accepting chemotaxis protein [Heliomicrobium gestii]MBM7866237.1 methyl-accepting chemotaxis protein [Heliomicrobium gestii]MZP42967.1 HAMP domain-containing protein [Heliomicrobium gestii]
MRQIKHKIMAAIMLTTFLLTAILGGTTLLGIYNSAHSEVANRRAQLYAQYDGMIKSQVDQAVGVLLYAYNKQQTGELTEAQAKKLATDLIKTFRYGDKQDGYFWIDALDCTLIAHPMLANQEGSNRKNSQDPKGVYIIQEVIAAAQGKNDGFSNFLWEKPQDVGSGNLTPKRAYSKLFKEWGWIVSTGNYVDEIEAAVDTVRQEQLEKTKREIIFEGLFSLLSLIISGAVAITLSRRITNPLKTMMAGIEKDASGKITIRDVQVEAKDEIGDLARSLNALTGQVRHFVQQVMESSNRITRNARGVEQSCEQLGRQSTETTAITQEINAAMEESAATIQEINATIEEVRGQTHSMNQSAAQGLTLSRSIDQRANTLREEAIASAQQAQAVFADMKAQLTAAIEGSREVEKIDELANAILRITEQTNLLALNAAIEAAHAGDVGRGFAVVAGEIRKLAEESARTVEDIQNIVSAARASVALLADTSGKAVDFMDEGVAASATKLQGAAEQYSADAKRFETFMEGFKRTCDRMDETMNSIAKSIEQMTAAVNESADGISQVAFQTANMQQQVGSIQEKSNETNDNIEKLNELVKGFDI